MAFHFSLQPVLRLRASYERLERMRLLALVAAIVRVRQKREALDKESRDAGVRTRERLAAGMAGGEMQFEIACEKLRSEYKHALEIQARDLDRAQKKQRQAYQMARQKREILENLRERRLEAYRREESRREQQRIDELFLLLRAATRVE
jgi:flagellar export protein FliJ